MSRIFSTVVKRHSERGVEKWDWSLKSSQNNEELENNDL